ncbi:MAG TPA: hypothetical protein VE977_01430 [Pyrinomonadaceae bacterium]|nr:hypothetical protein [Pyrinomonadaceae bacterium]
MSANSYGKGSAADSVRQAFANLQFDEKVSTLIRIELDMVGDAVDWVVSAASKAAEEVVKVCCDRQPSTSSDTRQPAAS